MAQPTRTPPDSDLEKVIELAFDRSKPVFYGNIFYVSGTQDDVRISFGTVRPVSHDSTAVTVDKFDVSVNIPHGIARQLARAIEKMLAPKGE